MEENNNGRPSFEWPTLATSYELLGKIGQGAFATVWKARTKEALADGGGEPSEAVENAETNSNDSSNNNAHECAVKVLNLDHVDSDLQEIRLEVQAMRLSSHPNVLQCCTAFVNDIHLWLVTPLMRKGSSLYCLQSVRRKLAQLKSQSQEPPCSLVKMEDVILYILRESLLGLQYIHDNGQIHRDIKAGNILLDTNGDVKIADFGVSGWLVHAGSQQEKAKTFVGTPCWMAPEVMEQVHGYDTKADIWSLGITALELAKGYAPYANYPPMKVLILTIQEDPPSLDTYENDEDVEESDNFYHAAAAAGNDEQYSKSFRALVDLCLQKNPNRRPTCQELLQGRYLQSLNDEAVHSSRRAAITSMLHHLVLDVGQKQQQQQSAAGSDSRPQTPDNEYSDDNVVHSNDATRPRRAPGYSPVSIILSTEKDRPPGTTWVFADGSQVLSSSMTGSAAAAATVDDVMAELDEFGKQTGGEHYYGEAGGSGEAEGTATTTTEPKKEGEGEEQQQEQTDNDLDDFMDEFEMHTAGEDFRHPSKKE